MNSYTPGLQVAASTRIAKLRELPLPGRVLVATGDRVLPDTPVLSAQRPGELDIVRLAERLGLPPEEVTPYVTRKEGDNIERGEILLERRSCFGLFVSKIASPAAGIVEFYTPANAHLGIRGKPSAVTVQAYISGIVVETTPEKSVLIETSAAFMQGIFGIGGERQGTLHALPLAADAVVTAEMLQQLNCDLAGKILLGGATFSADALKAAAAAGAAAVVTGSIDSAGLTSFVGREISVSVTGDEDVPLTLIISEGFGLLPLSARILDLARSHHGKAASVNGATQVRAGALRPELIIPLEESCEQADPDQRNDLVVGSRVRCLRVPYFGEQGLVAELPHQPELVPSGAVVRELRVKLANGPVVTVPRANVELLS